VAQRNSDGRKEETVWVDKRARTSSGLSFLPLQFFQFGTAQPTTFLANARGWPGRKKKKSENKRKKKKKR